MIIVRGRKSSAPSSVKDDTFVGLVYADPIVSPEDGINMNTITFTPGARTYWHYHEQGQILQVLAGEGWVCSEGGEPQAIRNGDTVWCPAQERHWHGATPTTYMVHIATSLGRTVWDEPVADYPAAQP